MKRSKVRRHKRRKSKGVRAHTRKMRGAESKRGAGSEHSSMSKKKFRDYSRMVEYAYKQGGIHEVINAKSQKAFNKGKGKSSDERDDAFVGGMKNRPEVKKSIARNKKKQAKRAAKAKKQKSSTKSPKRGSRTTKNRTSKEKARRAGKLAALHFGRNVVRKRKKSFVERHPKLFKKK